MSLIAIRTGVTTADVSYPAVGTGQSFKRSKSVRFYPELGSSTDVATITVLYAEDGEYKPVQAIIVTNEEPFDVDIDRNADVNAFITGITGTIGLKARASNSQ